ncbi:MAG: DUF2652 domain-containing protein [Bacteroidota bacterium]
MNVADNKSLIFIPDISGFTRFISDTEINHSRHIISELLEVVIDANDTGMTVAEIEGDAVLFYQENSRLTIEEVLSQVKKMFISFHEHLKLYESRRICECGACTTAVNLAIKFVVHFAEFGMIEVKHFRKPYGFEVVRAHRLLKNNINNKEYLLITDDSLHQPERQLESKSHLNWFKPETASINYDNFGDTAYHFSLLKDLHSEVNEPAPVELFEKSDTPITGSIFINGDINMVFEALSNFELRSKWQKGVTGMLYDHNKVNRIGTQHTCLIGRNQFKIETVSSGTDDGHIRTIAEKTNNVPLGMVKELISYFALEERDEGTHVQFEIHYKPQSFPRAFMAKIFRNQFEKSVPGFLNDLKSFCEKVL